MYGDAALFGVKFFGMDELMTQSNITPSDYKTLYPLFTFDVSKQKEKLKFSVVDIQIKQISQKMFPPTLEHLHWLFQTRCCHFNQTVTKCLQFTTTNLNMHILGMNILRFINIQLTL